MTQPPAGVPITVASDLFHYLQKHGSLLPANLKEYYSEI